MAPLVVRLTSIGPASLSYRFCEIRQPNSRSVDNRRGSHVLVSLEPTTGDAADADDRKGCKCGQPETTRRPVSLVRPRVPAASSRMPSDGHAILPVGPGAFDPIARQKQT